MKTVIVPAIDIINGECVRLSQGDYNRKDVYYKNPLDIAKQYEDAGVKRLHLVDLDGAKKSFPENLKVLEDISANTKLSVQYGGGIKSNSAIDAVFSSGADRAICGSIAVTSPELFKEWLATYGAEHIILGADVKNGMIATHGWIESSTISLSDLVNLFINSGLKQIITTDISKDGMLQGPSFDLYADLKKEFPTLDITVSGGISSFDDILKVNEMQMEHVIVGKAIYEGKITLTQIKEWLQNE